MRITDLEDNLRAHIWARIHRGELTGSGLSHDAGFQQAHMSNFLNARRGLSPEAMERLLGVLQVDVLDLADPEELRLRALQRPERASSFDSVPLVSLHDAAFSPRISAAPGARLLKFRKRFLQRLKPDTIGKRDEWLRFVLVKADVDQCPCHGAAARTGSGIASRSPLQLVASLPSRFDKPVRRTSRRAMRHSLCRHGVGAHHPATP